MKKVDQARYNKAYWAENEEMLRQPVYAQQIRQDRLTGRELVANELKELEERRYENEQAEARERQETKEEEARKERAEFEEWKRQKAEVGENARTRGVARTQEGG